MRKVLPVSYIDQTNTWPTGCESVSSVMLCHYIGVNISVDDFIKDYLPLEPMQFAGGNSQSCDYDSNVGTGPDPDQYFAGSPYDENSFGCYPGVIVKALNKCFAKTNEGKDHAVKTKFQAVDASSWNTEKLLEEIKEGRPVIYWATIDLEPSIEGPDWTLSDSAKDRKGETFHWTSNEHCMLLVGFDEEKDTLVFADPWHAHGIIDYDRKLVEKRHAEQKGRAVAIVAFESGQNQ